MIYTRFNPKYFFQDLQKEKDQIVIFVKNKKLLFKSDIIYLHDINKKEALYLFSSNLFNIPNNFYKTDANYKQFTSIKEFLDNKTLEFIFKHELGHLNHHQSLSLENNYSSFEYKILNSNSNYIKTDTSLDKLFDRTLSRPNPVEDFIHMNFMEAYADAYAGLTCYLQDKNTDIFDKICNFRKNEISKSKNKDALVLKVNKYDSLIAEIYHGKLSTSRYSNYLISDYINKNIAQQLSFDKLNNMSIDNLHSLIQLEVLKSLQETLKQEISNNKLFNNDFNKYLKDKNISIKDYFVAFESGIIEYKNKNCLSIIHENLLNNNKNNS